MPKAFPHARSAAKPFARRCNAWGLAGSGPNTGSLAPTRTTPEKKQRDRLIRRVATHPEWVLGFADEVWWSRLAQPQLHSWAAVGEELRLMEKAAAKDDLNPKALACYGLLMRPAPSTPEQIWVRFATGQPVSALTTPFLAWGCARLAALRKQALLLIWDHASWRQSRAVHTWIRTHNHQVKQA